MKRASTAVAGIMVAAMAGCASEPGNYAATLSRQDPKWQSPQCQQARMAALDYEHREKQQMGWGTGLLFPFYGLAVVAAVKEHQQKQRRSFARAVHLQCSSWPLPRELQVDPDSRPATTKYP